MWLLSHLLTILGFGLALVLLSRVLHERRAPANTMAWLLVILLAPYVGVPLYLIFGGRKTWRLAERKGRIYPQSRRPPETTPDSTAERILCAEGAPPAETGNRVKLLPTGEAAFEGLIEMLDGARRSIHIATFILGGGEVGAAVLDRLERKARAGVEVRLLLDALFSFRADRGALARLRKAGGKTAFFMPVLHMPFKGHANLRNHRKIAVVDGEHAMVGGMNLALEYMGPSPFPGRWRDVSMRIEGPAVGAIADIFHCDWAFAAGEILPPPTSNPPAPDEGEAKIQVVASGPDAPGDTLYDVLLESLFKARERIWIATPYFVPDEALARALILAVRRGVEVRILVPERSNHWAADLAGGRYLRQIEAAGGGSIPIGRG